MHKYVNDIATAVNTIDLILHRQKD